MILEENFTMEHIEEVKESRKVDKNILERSIYALGLSKIRNFDKLGFAYAVEAIRLLNR